MSPSRPARTIWKSWACWASTAACAALAVPLLLGIAELSAQEKDKDKDNPILTARQRQLSSNNLQQIGIALHNFHDTYRYLPPPAVCDKNNGKPLLSWRVLLLPFVEQGDLFREFKMEEAWDSEHNKKLLAKMPPIYAPVRGKTKEPHTTYYQAFVGKGAAFELKPNRGGPFGAVGLKFPDFRDGTSNTIVVAEAADPVPWTKPADLAFDPQKAPPKLGGLFQDGVHVLFADAAVLFLRKLDDTTLRALITR